MIKNIIFKLSKNCLVFHTFKDFDDKTLFKLIFESLLLKRYLNLKWMWRGILYKQFYLLQIKI